METYAFTVLGLDDPATIEACAIRHSIVEDPLTTTLLLGLVLPYQVSQGQGREMVFEMAALEYSTMSVPDRPLMASRVSTVPYVRSLIFQNFPLPSTRFRFLQLISIPALHTILFGLFDPSLKLPRTYEWNVSV
jgi:hypothetical protein